LVGEHTRDILAQMGIEPERIERLAQSGAVAVR
jgi:crotonobetainyl-CoA:carnitine CoA-transferase CaiB-like acyl-CoA transferase